MTAPRASPPAELPDHAGVAFQPPLLLLGSLVVGFVARRFVPLPFVPWDLAVPLGPMVVVASFGVFAWAVVTMRAGRASIPTSEPTDAIVTRGPYGLSRNPIYTAMLALLVGVGIWTDYAAFLLLAAVSAGLLWWGVISREERYLGRKFDAEYRAYKARVRRWI